MEWGCLNVLPNCSPLEKNQYPPPKLVINFISTPPFFLEGLKAAYRRDYRMSQGHYRRESRGKKKRPIRKEYNSNGLV